MVYHRYSLSALVEQSTSARSVRYSIVTVQAFKGLPNLKLLIRANTHLAQILQHTVHRVLTRDEFLKRDGMADARVDAPWSTWRRDGRLVLPNDFRRCSIIVTILRASKEITSLIHD